MTGSVKGRVLTRERMPVAGATVFIVKGPVPAPDIAPMSDDSGRFVLDGLGERTYILLQSSSAGDHANFLVVPMLLPHNRWQATVHLHRGERQQTLSTMGLAPV